MAQIASQRFSVVSSSWRRAILQSGGIVSTVDLRGFRTLGREVVGGWVEEHDAKFFASQDDAFEYLRTLTTPRCDANGNKLKKPTKKEAALAILKRIGAKKRTLIHGTEREEILGKIAFMVPVEKSSSLHWWSEDYIIDGVRYEVGGAHNSSNIELIERVEEIG